MPARRKGLDATPAFWFAMFAASAFGTNLGDFRVDWLSLGRLASFASLAVIGVTAIWSDRRTARRSRGRLLLAALAARRRWSQPGQSGAARYGNPAGA